MKEPPYNYTNALKATPDEIALLFPNNKEVAKPTQANSNQPKKAKPQSRTPFSSTGITL